MKLINHLLIIMQHSYTVTPSISENPVTGEVTYNVMDAEVTSSAPVEQAQRDNVRYQEQSYQEDEVGNLQFQPDITEADISNVIDAIGGQEYYSEMLEWAGQSLPDEDIEFYDNAMSSGDLNLIDNLIGQLQEMYENRSQDAEAPDEVTQYIFDNVCSPQEYGQIAEVIRNNLSDEEIDSFNNIISSGDLEYIVPIIQKFKQFI